MASGLDEGSLFMLSDDDDDLQEVPMSPPRRNENTRGNLILPEPDAPVLLRTTRAQRTTSRRSNQRATPLQQPPAVIDLTDEPDSPVRERRSRSQAQDRRSHSTAQGGRNPRRTNSQRISPPTLARSDGTFVGRPASFIDLTADSPPEGQGRPSGNLRSRGFPQPPPAPPRHPHQHPHAPRPRPDELFEWEIIETAPRSLPGSLPGLAIGISRRIAGILGRSEYLPFPAVPNGFPTAALDFTRAAWAPRESPKPPMEPIPPTRSGFTRNTCAEPEEDESIVICPACNEELAYDPSDTATQTASGAKKRKRAAGEHHFWALKKCGHVYCADCFENRKPTTRNRGVGFRQPHANSSVNDMRCAVEECNTKVIAKSEWVGIFL